MIAIPHPLTLTGQGIELSPLEEHHLSELEALAGDKRIWKHYPLDCSDPATFRSAMQEAFDHRAKEEEYPFVITRRSDGKIIGSTRFLEIQPRHYKLEIGWTWLHPDYWATSVNPEAKLLMLTYCFEELRTLRVQFKTNEHNIRSRKAIQKIGGRFEGIQRNHMLGANGNRRNSAFFSIIDEEWPQAKETLLNLIKSKQTDQSL